MSEQEEIDLEEVIYQGLKRRDIWVTWLMDYYSHVRHSDEYRNWFTGLDEWNPDPEPELCRMLLYLASMLKEGGGR